MNETKKSPTVEKPRRQGNGFDPSIVSEALWSQWQQTVIENELGHEKLGRLAPTLQALPTVIWHTPLSHYVNHTVAEIRQLKTHGEKRVRVVLEVFYLVHEMLASAHKAEHLDLRIVPAFIAPIENWIADVLAQPGVPSRGEVRDKLAVPLLDQILIDCGPTIHELSEARLGISGPPQSVRQQAKRMGVTRARVYQLLEDCAHVMAVRWPQGQQQLAQLAAKLQADATAEDDLTLFHATRELFYPAKGQLADEEAQTG